MAILAGAQAGSAPLPLNGTTTEALRLGASATITVGAGSTAASLPTDAGSSKYGALLLVASTNTWFNFNTAGDAAVAGATNTFLVTPNMALLVVPPVGTTQISAIQDSAGGKLCIIGIF